MMFTEVRLSLLVGLLASAVASIGMLVLIWRKRDPLLLKLGTTVVAIIPFIGPLLALWVVSFPDRMHPALQAKYKNTVNSYSTPSKWEKARQYEEQQRRDAA
jgi:hypothetical protein